MFVSFGRKRVSWFYSSDLESASGARRQAGTGGGDGAEGSRAAQPLDRTRRQQQGQRQGCPRSTEPALVAVSGPIEAGKQRAVKAQEYVKK